MKRFFAVVVLLLGINSSFADISPEQRYSQNGSSEGRSMAANACRRLPFSSAQADCLSLLSQADYVDLEAARICNSLSFTQNVSNCVQTISNKIYLEVDLQSCRSEGFDSNKISCLERKGRVTSAGLAYLNPQFLYQPKGGAFYPSQPPLVDYAYLSRSRNRAASICEKAQFQFYKDDCLRVVKEGSYFDVNATAQCARLENEVHFSRCVRAISNKSYLEAEVEKCSNETFDPLIISCLERAGRVY